MSAASTLTLEIEIAAPVPVVWMAFTNEQSFGQWYTPDPDWAVDVRTFSNDVGGKRIVAFGPKGDAPYVEEDELLEVVENEKLVFASQMHQGDHHYGATQFTLTFSPSDAGTTLRLSETGVNPDEVEDRRGGWTATLENLARLLADDSKPQTWQGVFDAPLTRVWGAVTQEKDVAIWFTPFEGAQLKVHECGYGVGEKRSITFGIGEPWEHTITETYLAIEEGKSLTFAVDMHMNGADYSTITGRLEFTEPNPGQTQIDLSVTNGPTPERIMRCAGWGATLANLKLVL
ncbi:MAG: SRPBCC family protein [Alphaproteobacteria bacterium]